MPERHLLDRDRFNFVSVTTCDASHEIFRWGKKTVPIIYGCGQDGVKG